MTMTVSQSVVLHVVVVSMCCYSIVVSTGPWSPSLLLRHLCLQPRRLRRQWHSTVSGPGGGGDRDQPVWLVVGACHQPQQWGGGGRLGASKLPEGVREQSAEALRRRGWRGEVAGDGWIIMDRDNHSLLFFSTPCVCSVVNIQCNCVCDNPIDSI